MAAAGAAPDGFFRCVYDGCLSGNDMGIERRPYHRNCGCALHKSRGHCQHVTAKNKNVSYPLRRAWSEGCLVLAASCLSSPSSSPVVEVGNNGRSHHHQQLNTCEEEDDEEFNSHNSYKV